MEDDDQDKYEDDEEEDQDQDQDDDEDDDDEDDDEDEEEDEDGILLLIVFCEMPSRYGIQLTGCTWCCRSPFYLPAVSPRTRHASCLWQVFFSVPSSGSVGPHCSSYRCLHGRRDHTLPRGSCKPHC